MLKKQFIFLFVFLPLIAFCDSGVNDSIIRVRKDTSFFIGQVSLWTLYTTGDYPIWVGAQYLPQFEYSKPIGSKNLFDLQVAAKISGSFGYLDPAITWAEGFSDMYRAWLRYSGSQFEVRLGLQKLNFGSASILRPLMWFDRMDARDPLQQTDGVWGLLGRYYFLNNANVWLWVLHGNKEPSIFDNFRTYSKIPEFGGRLQLPVPRGEAAFTYNHRYADLRYEPEVKEFAGNIKTEEHKMGFDVKMDAVVGVWMEASVTHKPGISGFFRNQHLLTIGADYTFPVGNGLKVTLENLTFNYNKDLMKNFRNNNNLSAGSLSYDFGLEDNLTALFYYNWDKTLFNLIRYKKQLNKATLFIMGYYNKDDADFFMDDDISILYNGKGARVMLVFYH